MENELQAPSRFNVLGGSPERTAADRVLALLVDAIRAGVFEVGDRLPSLRELAKEVGSSHVVVREAVGVLVETKVLEVRRGRVGGVFLVGLGGLPQALSAIYELPTTEEARGLLEARFVVERAVVRRAVTERSVRDLADLGALVSRLHHSPRLSEFTEITVRFHVRMALAAGNPTLTSFLREVLNRMAIYGMQQVGRTMTESEIVARGVPLYARLYDALVHSDREAAERWVDDHISYVEDLYDFELRSSPIG